MRDFNVAVVCSSNMNRSMAAHLLLKQHGYNVSSFGTGTRVKLPGPAENMPNIYEFGTPYAKIHRDLLEKDRALYERQGILEMLDRNLGIKECPERLQDSREEFKIIFCFEERILDAVVEELMERGVESGATVHIVNMNVKDNHVQAKKGAELCLRFCEMVSDCDDLDEDIEKIIDEFEKQNSVHIMHTVSYY